MRSSPVALIFQLVTVSAVLTLSAAATPCPQFFTQPSFSVVYFGPLFGDLRIPDKQTVKTPQPPLTVPSPAQGLIDLINNSCGGDNQVIVSTGSNFAPNVNSRDLFDHPALPSCGPKDLFNYNYLGPSPGWLPDSATVNCNLRAQKLPDLQRSLAAGNGKIDFDNVAEVLSEAHVDAMVPGWEDFYYGPERLRELARLLAARTDHAVQMLASNLVISTSVHNQYPRLPNILQPDRGFAREYYDISVSLPSTVLPSLREFDISNAYLIYDITKSSPGTRVRSSDLPEDIKVIPEAGPGTFVTTNSTPARHFRTSLRFSNPCLYENPRSYTDNLQNPDELDSKKQTCIPLIVKELPKPADGKAAASKLTEDATLTFKNKDDHLDPDRNYHLCLTLNAGKSPFCSPFSVYAPFLQYHHPPDPAIAGEPAVISPQEWLLKKTHWGPNGGGGYLTIAVFGVVDPELLNTVGLLNYSWLNVNIDKQKLDKQGLDKRFETTVTAMDPKLALDQVLQTCQLDTVCDKARKILLAQMPLAKARALAAQLSGEFDLVIAQADAAQFTEAETIKKSPAPPDSADDAPKPQPFAIAPRVHESKVNQSIDIRTQRAVVSLGACPGAECGPPTKLENEFAHCRVLLDAAHSGPSPQPCTEAKPPEIASTPRQDLCSGSGTKPLYCLLKATLKPAAIERGAPDIVCSETLNPNSPEYALECVSIAQIAQDSALAAMNHKFHTDVAFLQQRDLYDPARLSRNPVSLANLQDALDQIFWKGDFVVTRPITGANIKSVLKQSDAFGELDKSSVSNNPNHNRSLLKLGVFQSSDLGKLVIGGDPIDEIQIYGVAMTDYLAFGDTGYSDLQKPAVPAAGRVTPDMKLYSLSGVVCERIKTLVAEYHDAACRSEAVTGAEYLDRTDHKPFDSTPGMTPARNLQAWLDPQHLFDRTFHDVHDPIEMNQQQRGVWSLTLEKADFGLSLNQHNNGTEANLASRFEGIPIAPVSAADSTTYSSDWRLWLRKSIPAGQFFAMTESNYSNTSVRSITTNAYQPSQSLNQLAFESGWMTRIAPFKKKRTSSWFLLSSVREETELRKPYTTLYIVAPSDVSGTTNPFEITGRTFRTEGVYGKLGFRFEDPKSWFETGYQPGFVLNSPVGYTFSTPTANSSVSCYAYQAQDILSAAPIGESLYNCLDTNSSNPFNPATPAAPNSIYANSTLKVIQRTLYQNGFFLNLHAAVPLPMRLFRQDDYWVIENRGNFFLAHEGDVSLETRYFVDFTNSFVIPLVGNLSLSPKLEMFFFENQVDGHPFHAYQTTVSLSYWFRWHQGLGFKNALRYPYSQPNP